MTLERDPLVRDQVSRLMGVLRRLAIAKNSPIRHTSRYDAALWLDAVQDHCTIQVPEGPGDEILRVARVPREPEPVAPREVRDWISRQPESDSVPEPTLRERNRIGGDDVFLVEVPGVRSAFRSWMVSTSRPWAVGERIRRPRLRIFEALFDIHRTATDRPESVELVLSSGLLHLPGPPEQGDIRIHLITQPLRVDQDPSTGEMVCVLTEEDGVRLEDDELLSGLPMFDSSGSAAMRDRLLELAESPLSTGVTTFLKEWAPRALTVACGVADIWEQQAGPQPSLVVAPAIVARRRGAFALRAYYDAMTKSLADPNRPVPLGLAQLVRAIEPDDRLAWLERAGATAAADLATDPLFPLPANEEQAAIITRLGADTGVVVEGPPGTGKTHTIANLVSALLAQGQRVLVTSEKAQALRVLRDKLPSGMQELCVSITDASAKGNSDLARSVATMAGQRTDFNPERAERQIVDLAARREETRRRRSELLEDIRALRESETYQHPQIAPGYSGTLSSIARTLVESAEQDSWVTGYARGEPPVSTSELGELLMLLNKEDPHRSARRGQRLPDAVPLPVNYFAQLVVRVRAGDAVRSGRSGGLVTILERLPPEPLLRLDPVCREVAEAVAQVRLHPVLAMWSFRTTDMLLGGDGMHRWQRAIGQLPAVDVAERCDRDADFAVVDVAAAADPAAAASVFERFAAHLADGSSMRRLFKSNEQKEVERIGRDVLVNGAVPTTAAAAAAAGHHLRFVELARRIDAAFQPVGMGLPSTTDRAPSLDAMHGIRRACASVQRLVAAASALQQLLAVLPPQDRPALMRVPELERVAAVALAVGQARSAAVAQAEIDAAGNALLASVPSAERAPEMIALIDALRALDPSGYESAVGALAEASRQQTEQRRCDDLRTRLRELSPAVADDVESRSADQVWASRLSRWPQAWARACAASWIAEQTGPGREQVLDGQLAVAVSELHRLTGDLAAARAWKACLKRMNAEQVQALQSYRNSVARVGKGTGKFAERFRQSAREAMIVAQAAVPAWVMPIQQVLASVPPQPDSFDVVIVDEASQADLTSAFLLWLAPRVIVVGDDKQCTPSEVASGALQPVFDRLDAELHDIPSYLRTAFTPKDSLFSLLRTRFGQVVRLREHFRSMPEIITWSSGMFYRDAPLVPLRQFGADRLPPLRHTFVAGAETEGSTGRVANRAEALAIAESVRACLDDPAYERRTFGIVVLQSSQTQVDLINHELRQRVSASEWEERRIRVGTAPDFQGDERHVVWLSMVAAPNSPLTALTRDTFRQSYNVAASRAQDQLWLFHSVTPDLLRETDLRRSLLTYMLSGGSSAIVPVLTDVDPDRRHDAFDSLFEQRVFLDLIARGYHVTPQVESNRRRIDLVITGASGKLAVECDGEAFHTTPEQRGADLDREQELKRCGWTFERIRESIYYLDREKALAPVWQALDRLGIGPLGSVADGTWTPLQAVDEPVERSVDATVETAEPEARPELEPIFPAAVAQELLGPTPDRNVEPEDAEPDQDHRAAVLRASSDIRLTNESVRSLLGITRDEALHVLQAMVAEGLLERRGSFGGTHYVAVAGSTTTQEHDAISIPVALPHDEPAEPKGSLEPAGPVALFEPPPPSERRPAPEPPSPTQAMSPSGEDLGDRDFLLQAAQRQPLTTVWVAEHLALAMPEARALLQGMVDGGLLRRTGQTKGTRYVPIDWAEAEGAPARFVISSQQRVWVLRAAQNRRLTIESVRGLLRIEAGQAAEVLSTLVEEGVLERHGLAEGTYYMLTDQREDPDLASVPAAPRTPTPVKAPEQLDKARGSGEQPGAAEVAAAEFEREMRRLYERTLKETGYKATRFLSLVSEHGGVATAHQLLAAGSVSVGFTELWERRRLDLTVEAAVLKPQYVSLFRESERETARYRLSEHGHVVEAGEG